MEHLKFKLAEKEEEADTLKRELHEKKSHQKHLTGIKTPIYNGTTDFDEYLNQFMSICEYHEWSDEDAAIMLLAKLEGDALSVAAALDDQILRSLITNLRRHFSQEQEEVATLKLHGPEE